ncbi:glycosyltransferase family 2 protein [Ignavibacterium sp.]|uniref:glycosyltransferase n=1 Tax=Ignavibacterium sp. TaxID=2651167 RepID=UPI00307EF25E
MITALYIISFAFVSIIFIVSLSNLFSAPVLKIKSSAQNKLVSILIPARNEERNIQACLDGCLTQTYTNKEIIVLDDNSTDNTLEILNTYSYKIKIINGKQLPEDWLGKNWACSQLAQHAQGDYLLFIDADVRLNNNAVESAVEEITLTNSALISVFPTQKIKSFSEWLIVPLMNWLLLGFLPLVLVYSSRNKSFVAANGQFMLWRKEIYDKLGGHSSLKYEPVEDMEFARICKSKGIKIKTLLGGKLIFCRMYSNLKEAINGFAKNFFAGFKTNAIGFLIFISLISLSSLLPLIIWKNLYYSAILSTMIILSRIFISIKSNQNILMNLILHPFQMMMVFIIGIISIYKTKFGKLEWKERKI